MPFNVLTIPLGGDDVNQIPLFPLDRTAPDCEFKIAEATIDGDQGTFYGSFKKEGGQPSGNGIFCTGEWIHYGRVTNGVFTGRSGSINKNGREMRYLKTKYQSDGTQLQKVEQYQVD